MFYSSLSILFLHSLLQSKESLKFLGSNSASKHGPFSFLLVPRPKDKNVIGTKWIFRNKLNEDEKMSKKRKASV